MATDVRDWDDIGRVVAVAVGATAPRAVVNNAGASPPATPPPRRPASPAPSSPHLISPLLVTQRANEVMQDQPKWVESSTSASLSGMAVARTAAYGAAKAGLIN